jgi:DNA processing protein
MKQAAKLVATWEDVGEELPPDVRLALEPAKGTESQTTQTASLFGETVLSAHERKIMALLKPDEARNIDEIVERLERQLSSSEIFAALFELELAGRVKRLPGKNFVKSLSLLSVSYRLSAFIWYSERYSLGEGALAHSVCL